MNNLSSGRLGDQDFGRRSEDAGLSPAHSTISAKKKDQLKSALRKVDRQISKQFEPWRIKMLKLDSLRFKTFAAELKNFTKLDEKRKNIRNKLKGYEIQQNKG